MATGTVPVAQNKKATVFSLSAGASAVTYFSGYGVFDPNTSTVRIYFVARNTNSSGTTTFGTTTALTVIPEAYRPSENKYLYATIFTYANSTVTVAGNYFCTVGTDGKIVQNLTNSGREVFAVGEYVI